MAKHKKTQEIVAIKKIRSLNEVQGVRDIIYATLVYSHVLIVLFVIVTCHNHS